MRIQDPSFPRDMSLGEASVKFLDMVQDKDGHHCPCCFRFYKLYDRKINLGHVLPLIEWYQKVGTEPARTPEVLPLKKQTAFTQCKLWGLVEPSELVRDKRTITDGVWRVTEFGQRWLRGEVRIKPRVIVGYSNGRKAPPAIFARLGDEKLGDKVSILQLPDLERFDLEELMRA